MTQHRSQQSQFEATNLNAPPDPEALQGATFYRPTRSVHQQAHHPLEFNQGAKAPYHEPLVPGGQGPLAGLRSSVPQPNLDPQPVAQDPEMPPSEGELQGQVFEQEPLSPSTAIEYAQQAFNQPAARPSFPAAPSKVLAEQYAQGGDGYIRHADTALADDMPAAVDGPLLEGMYPAPHSAPQPALGASLASKIAARSPHPSPRSQPIDPALQTKLAAYGEPDLAERGNDVGAQAAYRGAFGAYDAQSAPSRPRNLAAFAISGAVLLLALLAFGTWAQLRNTAAPSDPVRITAAEGPERIVPEDPGGLQIADQDLGVLNPGALLDDGTLMREPTVPAAQLDPDPIPDTADQGQAEIIVQNDIQIPLETTNTPQFDFAPVVRPAQIPARLLPDGTGSAPTESSTSLIITADPTQLYVQEGSYASLESAQAAYGALKARSGTLFTNISPRYFKAAVDGQTRYRLYLVGFRDVTSAASVGGALGRSRSNWVIKNI